jgi:hypothetical protein
MKWTEDLVRKLYSPTEDLTEDEKERVREEYAEELAVRFELLNTGPYPVRMITNEEAASFARETVCPTCGELDNEDCNRQWHLARKVLHERGVLS